MAHVINKSLKQELFQLFSCSVIQPLWHATDLLTLSYTSTREISALYLHPRTEKSTPVSAEASPVLAIIGSNSFGVKVWFIVGVALQACIRLHDIMVVFRVNALWLRNLNFIIGNKDYDFDKTRKIPLLSEVFDAVKDEELVMYLNVS